MITNDAENSKQNEILQEEKSFKSTLVNVKSHSECLFKHIYDKYPYTTLFTLIGLLVALLLIVIGFWKTLLIIIFAGSGFLYGQYKDKSLWIYNILKKIFK